MIPPSTPIGETLKALKLDLEVPTACRTADDLLVVIDRKEVQISAVVARKVREAIG